MAKASRSGPKPQNRRGSPEAIEKRRAGRLFNDVLGGRGVGPHKRDGRTEKRRQRMIRELESGKVRGSRELKPLDVLQRVHELLELGEPLRSIRKVAKAERARCAHPAIRSHESQLLDKFWVRLWRARPRFLRGRARGGLHPHHRQA